MRAASDGVWQSLEYVCVAVRGSVLMLLRVRCPASARMYEDWRSVHCQPNYYRHFVNQNASCPPYLPPTCKSVHGLCEVRSGGSGTRIAPRRARITP